MAINPVCRMEIDPAKVVVAREYQEDTYYF
jgi:YHS domain-containing protein